MGTNTLNARSNGQTILDTFFNDFNTALDGDLVGRNSSGVPSAGQNLGTVAIPWGVVNALSIVLNGSALDTSKITSPVNRIVSGKMRSTSNQPQFITPNGAAPSFIVAGASVSLVYDVNGTAKMISTDITKSSLTVAPNTQNTALVNDTDAAGQGDTRLWGEPEHRKAIVIDTVGSNITALVGKYAAFKIGAEYFFALVESSTKLSHARRGYFYDSSGNPVNRVVFSDDDTITLLKLGWVFADADQATIDVSYNNPFWGAQAPGSPATGDYWYDLVNKTWKRYDGATFQIINRTLIGVVCLDTANCIGARCIDFYANYESTNGVEIEFSTTEIAIFKKTFSRLSVAGNVIEYGDTLQKWNITTDLAGSADMYNPSEQASTMYYLYLKDNGAQVISDISPYFRSDLYGMYHPHNPWRCVGMMYNDGSSNIIVASDFKPENNQIWLSGMNSSNKTGSVFTSVSRFKDLQENTNAGMLYDSTNEANNGAVVRCFFPAQYAFQLGVVGAGDITGISYNATDTELANTINSLSAPKNLAQFVAASSPGGEIGFSKQFKIGDRVAPHTESGSALSADSGRYTQWKVALVGTSWK